jgi:hypothetical protein
MTSSNGWTCSWLSPLWTLITLNGYCLRCFLMSGWECCWVSLHNRFYYILMLFINLSPLCYIHVWCINMFISHRLHLLFILFLCMFLNMLMFDLFYLYPKTFSNYSWHFLKSTCFRKALALFLNIRFFPKWPLPTVKSLYKSSFID